MRTNIVIDDDLMNEAMTLSKIKTKKAVVETGLKLLVQIKKQEQLRRLRGKLIWEGDLEKMRLDQ
jgi:Arc/MetJ family transcription regulator